MASRQPPRTAIWIAHHFGSGSRIDELLGDLAELYGRNGRTAWFWFQILKAIPVSAYGEIREHKQVSLSALMTGWAAWIICGLTIPKIPLFQQLVVGRWSFWLNPVLGGGMLGLPLDDSATFRLVLTLAFSAGFPLLVGALSGQMLVRIYPRQRAAMPLLFASSILLADLLLFGGDILRSGVPAPYIFNTPLAANIAMSLVGILLGGIVSSASAVSGRDRP